LTENFKELLNALRTFFAFLLIIPFVFSLPLLSSFRIIQNEIYSTDFYENLILRMSYSGDVEAIMTVNEFNRMASNNDYIIIVKRIETIKKQLVKKLHLFLDNFIMYIKEKNERYPDDLNFVEEKKELTTYLTRISQLAGLSNQTRKNILLYIDKEVEKKFSPKLTSLELLSLAKKNSTEANRNLLHSIYMYGIYTIIISAGYILILALLIGEWRYIFSWFALSLICSAFLFVIYFVVSLIIVKPPKLIFDTLINVKFLSHYMKNEQSFISYFNSVFIKKAGFEAAAYLFGGIILVFIAKSIKKK